MKTALITGTGSSIGREVALFLGLRGYKILTHGSRKKESLKITHELLNQNDIPYTPYLVNFADLEKVEEACEAIVENEERIDAMVFVAGGTNAFGHDRITSEQIVDSININLVANMIITHKLIPLLQNNSLLLYTSAMPGIHSGWYPTDGCYDAAKGGILRFAENMARNLAPKTRVNSIIIGLNDMKESHKALRKAREAQIPMKRIANPADFVRCVDFFVEHEHMTGVSLPLDGGWSVFNVNPPYVSPTDWGNQ